MHTHMCIDVYTYVYVCTCTSVCVCRKRKSMLAHVLPMNMTLIWYAIW